MLTEYSEIMTKILFHETLCMPTTDVNVSLVQPGTRSNRNNAMIEEHWTKKSRFNVIDFSAFIGLGITIYT